MEIDSVLPSTFNKKSINCAKNFVQFQSNRVENFINNKRAGLNEQAGKSFFKKFKQADPKRCVQVGKKIQKG